MTVLMENFSKWAFEIPSVWEKIANIQRDTERALKLSQPERAPMLPSRDIMLLDTRLHPNKKGFSTKEGQARMLHDLASIELQAMELGLRTLVEFPEAPQGFREELLAVTVSEAEHLRLCLEGLNELGFQWGDWPVHCGLWTAVDREDSLLDRILIVHRYLEGSGLDAGSMLLRRLDGVDAPGVRKIVKQINEEEVGHVDFGSQWYRRILIADKQDPNADFGPRMDRLRDRLPKRIENINRELRLRAGFNEIELDYYEKLRQEFLIPFKVRRPDLA